MIDKDILEKRNKLIDIDETIKSLRERKELELKELQSKCKHEIILRCEYKSLYYCNSLPPLRLCMICSLEEEEWQFLSALGNKPEREIREVLRDELYRNRNLQPFKNVITT